MKRDSHESSPGLTDSTDKLDLLDYLLAEEGVESVGLKSRISADVREVPLSFAQQRLWFLDQMEGGGSVYNVPAAFELAGRLDVEALHRALNEILRRHEALRTIFQSRDGLPFQVVTSAQLPPLSSVDLWKLPDKERSAEVLRRLTENATSPFDLARGPVFRASLLRLDEDRHVLLLCIHHIVSDGWSLGILYRELSDLYQAFSAGQSSPLPELQFHYSDFSIWQRQWLQGDRLEKQLDYWKQQLSNVVQGTLLGPNVGGTVHGSVGAVLLGQKFNLSNVTLTHP